MPSGGVAMNKENQIQQIADEAIKKIQAIRDAREGTEYRAGEWVPDIGKPYYYVGAFGVIGNIINRDNESDVRERCKYPNRAVAEAAKAHADWWREFDKIRDEAAGETARAEMYLGRITYTIPPLHIGATSIERLGGEQKVIEMLNKGRVFRFKLGGQ